MWNQIRQNYDTVKSTTLFMQEYVTQCLVVIAVFSINLVQFLD